MNKDAQPYGPWLRASPDHLQKPQVVRVSGQDTHQVNHGTKSPGNLRRTVAEQVRSTGDMVQHKLLLNPNISGTSSPPVHHVPKDPEFPSIQKISAIPIDFEAHIREIDRVLEWKVSEMVEKDKEISNSISPLSNDVASKSNGADITPLHGPTLEGPQGEVNKSIRSRCSKNFVILPHQMLTLLFYHIILQHPIYQMFYNSILYIKIIFTTS